MKLKMKEVHLDSLDGRAKVQQVGEEIKLNKKNWPLMTQHRNTETRQTKGTRSLPPPPPKLMTMMMTECVSDIYTLLTALTTAAATVVTLLREVEKVKSTHSVNW